MLIRLTTARRMLGFALSAPAGRISAHHTAQKFAVRCWQCQQCGSPVARPVDRLACSLVSIGVAMVLSACTAAAPAQPYNEALARRCGELLALFDKYGVQHSQGSGGPDIIYVVAGIDCGNGRYAQGIRAMEDLLQRNKIPYPPA